IGWRCCANPGASTTAPPPPAAVAPAPSLAPTPSLAPAPPPRVADDRPRDVVKGPQKGALSIPANASGHRVFVDGRVVPSSLGTAVVDCGTHTVKIGHDGRDQVLDVPCGARVRVE